MLGIGVSLRHLRGTTAAVDAYKVAGFKPDLVFDFEQEYYRTSGTQTTFDSAITHIRSGNATMVDSDGLLKWAPHNLALNSATPATQSITVVSGADYTVECTGVSIVLFGAGTGTVTEGNPVTITASTTTLTMIVTGSTGTMWAYRSDLGGMVNNPDRGDSYVPTTSAARYLARRGHHVYNGSEWVNEGALFEPTGSVQLLHTTDALVTQSHTVTAEPHTLHFTGTGTVTLSGAYSGSLVGTGTGEENRVSLTFTPTAASLTLTVSGTVSDAQLEVGSVQTSYIPNLAASGTVTRAADTLTVPSANLPWPTPNVIGPELVTNGTFDTDTDWTKGTGWSISGGLATHSGGVSSGLTQNGSFPVGKVYKVSFEISGWNGFGLVIVQFDGGGGSDSFTVTSNGTYTRFVTTTLNRTRIALFTASGWDGSIDNISVREIDPLAVSIQMQGRMTYADEDSGFTPRFLQWIASGVDLIDWQFATAGSLTGSVRFQQASGGIFDAVTGPGTSYAPGVNVPFNIASRHGSTFINGAVDGTALTANTTPTALPDLSTTDLSLAYSGGPMILKRVRIWADDLGDSDIAEASA